MVFPGEKVQRWSKSQLKGKPEGTTVYKKNTKYAPAKKNSTYKVVKCK